MAPDISLIPLVPTENSSGRQDSDTPRVYAPIPPGVNRRDRSSFNMLDEPGRGWAFGKERYTGAKTALDALGS